MSGGKFTEYEERFRSLGITVWDAVDQPLARVGTYIDIVFTLLLLSFFCVLLFVTPNYDLQSQIFPLLVGLPGVLLTFVLFLAQIGVRSADRVLGRISTADTSAGAEDETDVEKNRKGTFTMVFWVFFLFALLTVFGFLLGALIFLLLFYRFEAGNGWIRTISYAAAIWIPIVIVFEFVLSVRFSGGMISSLVSSLPFVVPGLNTVSTRRGR